MNNSEFCGAASVGRCHSIDGALPEGLWSTHEIIFSCHIYLKVVFHSEQSTTIDNVERFQNYKNDIMDLQDFTVLTDMVQNASQCHECWHLSHQGFPMWESHLTR